MCVPSARVFVVSIFVVAENGAPFTTWCGPPPISTPSISASGGGPGGGASWACTSSTAPKSSAPMLPANAALIFRFILCPPKFLPAFFRAQRSAENMAEKSKHGRKAGGTRRPAPTEPGGRLVACRLRLVRNPLEYLRRLRRNGPAARNLLERSAAWRRVRLFDPRRKLRPRRRAARCSLWRTLCPRLAKLCPRNWHRPYFQSPL